MYIAKILKTTNSLTKTIQRR